MEKLSSAFLENIAKQKNIPEARAAELIDLCIKMVSAQLNISFSDVYNYIYDVDYLTNYIKSSVPCPTLSLDECKKSLSCVEFEGKCHPRYFKDADQINEDPDKYVDKMPTDVLAKLVKLAAYLYYNYDSGGLTDNSYEALEYHLNKRLKMRGRRYEKIGAPPIDKIRVKLPYPMGSLDKVKPGSRELFDFLIRASSTGLVYSLKLDGVSALVIYKSGVPDKMYTRGDGIIGGDITYLLNFIKLPEIKDINLTDVVVRGELILKRKIWDEKYKGSYSNARSFVSAKVNSGHVSQGLNDLDFVAYEIVHSKVNSILPSEAFLLLKNNNFNVVHNKKFENQPTVFDLITIYKNQRTDTSEYVIDGLVLTLDVSLDKNLKGPGNPKNSVAFKMRLEEQIRKTKVTGIEWRLSRYGRYVPVALYESVYIEGVRLHRASAFNAAHVRDWSLGKGSNIKVVRSGDVIPTIVDVTVDESIEPIFPPTDPGWHWKGVDIILNDPDSSKVVQIKRIEHFFITIGVPRLREKTIEKMWDFGLKTIKDITNAKPEDFIKIKGIGKKTSESHYKNIHDVMRKTRLDRYIPASTVLNLGIGRKLVKQLMRYHPTILNEDSDQIRRMLKKKEIPGFGAKRIENVASNVPKFREFLFSLNEDDIKFAMKHDQMRREMLKKNGFNPKIRGKTFVLTGFYGRLDLSIEDYIYDNLGNFSDTVTGLTEAVISANILETSKKIETALKLEIPILSLEEFSKKYDIKSDIPDTDIDDEDREDENLGIKDEVEN
jgi:DNA ligase (NAD+)